MKQGWEARTLAEACEFHNGLWKGEKPPYTRIGVIRNTNFTKEGTLNNSDIAYLEVEIKKLEKRRLRFGDIILEKSGGGPKQPVGRVALFVESEGEFSFSNFTAALRVRDPQKLDFRFLHKLLHWTYLSGVTEGMQSHSTGIRNLDGEAYKAIRISFPPLPEQKRIVAILDKAFEGIDTAIANTEKNLANARELFDSYLNSVFANKTEAWMETRLGDIGKTQYGLSEKMNEDNLGYKIFRMGEVQNGQLLDTGKMKYADITLTEFRKYKLRIGDILFNRTNSYELVGKTGIFNLEGDYCFASYLVRVETDRSRLIPEFLNYFMNSSAFQESVKQKASRSINQANINATILANERVILPRTVSEQLTIVENLNVISAETQRLQGTYQQKLASLPKLKQTILKDALSGKLTAQSAEAVQEAVE